MKGTKAVKEIVRTVLTNRAAARDSDTQLTYYVFKELGVNPDLHTLTAGLAMISNGELPPIDSITRYRRMVQEEDAALRGKNYERRKAHEQRVVDRLRAGKDPFAGVEDPAEVALAELEAFNGAVKARGIFGDREARP
jgi:hypothetical protein